MNRLSRVFLSLSLLLGAVVNAADNVDYTVHLATGSFVPQQIDVRSAVASVAMTPERHYLVQFTGPVTDAARSSLAANGVILLDYIPNFAYTARLTRQLTPREIESQEIRWIGGLTAEQKISPIIRDNGIPFHARRGNDLVQLGVILQRDQDLSSWSTRLTRDFGATVLGTEQSAMVIEVIVPESAYQTIAALDEVLWVEPAMPTPEEHNDNARSNNGAATLQIAPYNLTGNGITVAEWDGGRADENHADFEGRVISLDAASLSTHATHVAGTVVGGGVQNSLYKGMAPDARLLTQLWWNSSSEASSEYSSVINTWDALVATNSWGYGVGSPATQSACEGTMGAYFSTNSTIDNIVRGSLGTPITICWSAGNQRSTGSDYCGSLGWSYNTVSPPGTGKNIISVGAINSNNNTMTSFSSWGPTDDGRIKPDVVGPGCQSSGDGGLTSTKLTTGYTTLCGTSMSTPATAGLIALLMERHALEVGGTILPSTVRGILINSAIDLGTTGPDYANGHGKVDGVAAAKKIGVANNRSWVEGEISTGGTIIHDLTVPSGTTKLKVTLAWDDVGGTSISGVDLINDLDLVLIDPTSQETQPWILNKTLPSVAATRGIDRLNNVETVEINSPAAGLWKAKVTGFNIPTGPQKYSLVFTPDSINTPGSQNAVSVISGADQSALPGSPAIMSFAIQNIGGGIDSFRVQIADTSGWVAAPLDTTVIIAQFDSAVLAVSATVPPGSLAGAFSEVVCETYSLTDTLAQAARIAVVSAGAFYDVALSEIPQSDTILSPGSHPFSVRINNLSNIQDSIVVMPSAGAGWTFAPSTQPVLLPVGGTALVNFTAQAPAELTHLENYTIVLAAASSDPSGVDTAFFELTAYNPLPPPILLSPEEILYTKDGRTSFAWSGAADSFALLLFTDPSLSTLFRRVGGLSDTTYQPSTVDSLPDGHYYWAVRRFSGTDSSSLQASPRSLLVDNEAPLSANRLTPADQAIISTTAQLTYETVAGSGPAVVAPEFYRVRLAYDSGFTSGLQVVELLTQTTADVTSLLTDGRWYWQVERYDLAGNTSTASTTGSFLLDRQAPDVATLLAPADLAVIPSVPIVLRFSGSAPVGHETSREYFYVHVSKLANFADFTFTGYVYADSLVLTTPMLVNSQSYYWRVKTNDSAGFTSNYSAPRSFTYQSFVCGDLDNSNGTIDIADLTFLVAYLFLDGTEPNPLIAADLNCDTIIDIADLTTMVDFLFISNTPFCCQ